MSNKFSSCIYCQSFEVVKILESLSDDLITVPKEVLSGDMDLCVFIEGVITAENAESFTVKVNNPTELRKELAFLKANKIHYE